MWKPLIGSCRYKTRSVFWIAPVSCKNRTELLETHCCLQTPLAIHYLSNLSCRYHLQLILVGEDVMTWSCSGVTWRLLVEAALGSNPWVTHFAYKTNYRVADSSRCQIVSAQSTATELSRRLVVVDKMFLKYSNHWCSHNLFRFFFGQ